MHLAQVGPAERRACRDTRPTSLASISENGSAKQPRAMRTLQHLGLIYSRLLLRAIPSKSAATLSLERHRVNSGFISLLKLRETSPINSIRHSHEALWT